MLLLVKVSASVSGSIFVLTIVDRGLCVPSLIMFGSPSHMLMNNGVRQKMSAIYKTQLYVFNQMTK